ncbi:MAG: DUF3574 domain-containing protein [Mucilaginibacter sp.]|uniref:DUF3574 domain-containing protein n=1 Tax=Mucilaginibacter sp. TaxID=1882438 RepID=UPI0032661B19
MLYRLLLICLLLSSCAANRMVETDLYFGMSKPDGGSVTDKEWESFRENYIVTAFKQGSTIINASGSWLDPVSRKQVTEASHLVIYLHKKSKAVSKQIDSLRKQYQTQFQQQSVLRVDKKVTVAF